LNIVDRDEIANWNEYTASDINDS